MKVALKRINITLFVLVALYNFFDPKSECSKILPNGLETRSCTDDAGLIFDGLCQAVFALTVFRLVMAFLRFLVTGRFRVFSFEWDSKPQVHGTAK